MKVAVIIPTRRDRPGFLENCLRMMAAQTLQPVEVLVSPQTPEGGFNTELPVCDITRKYREGYDRLRGKGYDLIAFVEDDDWYAPAYLETMAMRWIEAGQPDIFGTDYTIYYHLKLLKWFVMNHPRRASAMNTILKPDMLFDWCPDNEPYTDIHLWQTLTGVTFKQTAGAPVQGYNDGLISMGMKHGVGMCGGRNHLNYLDRFTEDDVRLQFLKANLDPESFKFYAQVHTSLI